jgi:hypothetical protein
MRQVDRAELTYRLYSAMRKWSITLRRRMFNRQSERRTTDQWVGADQIVRDLRDVEYYLEGRQVEAETISGTIRAAIDRFPGGLCAMWLSSVRERQQEAQATAANLVADALAGFDILMATSDHHSAFTMDDRLKMFRFPVIRVDAAALKAQWP